MKEETRRLLTIAGVFLVIIVLAVIMTVSDNLKAQKYVEKVEKAFSQKENTLVYLGRESCGYCQLLAPTLKEYAKDYKFDYIYIDTDKAKSKMTTILKKFNIKQSEFGTPYLAVVKDGKIIKEQNGYVTEDKLFTFLKDTGFINKDAKLALNYLDYNAYKEKLDSNNKTIFTIIQTGCSHCENAKPVLKEIAKEYNLDINIINLADFSEDTQRQDFMESLSYYNDEQWGTPLILVVEDKKVLDSKQGFVSKDDYITFFKKNGYIK